MSKSAVKVAMVGLGFGAEFIPIYQRHPRADVVAICRRNEAELNKVGDRYEISLVISRGGRDADHNGIAENPIEWQRVQQSLVEMKLLDDNGRALERGSFSSGGSDQQTEVTMSFSGMEVTPGGRNRTGPPSKLVWRIATEVRDVLIPFEFKGVPLPR